MSDNVNNPKHYTSHPSGVECLDIVRHMGFNLGNAVKYIWRAALKGKQIEDLRKAVFYLEDEIKRLNESESTLYFGEWNRERTNYAETLRKAAERRSVVNSAVDQITESTPLWGNPSYTDELPLVGCACVDCQELRA